MKKCLFTCTLVFFGFICISAAQNAKKIGLISLKEINGKWFKVEKNSEYLVDENIITIKLKSDSDAALELLVKKYKLTVVRKSSAGFIDLSIPKNSHIINIAERLFQENEVDILDINTIGKFHITPNDTDFSSQWALLKIGMPEVWNMVTGNSCIDIAVLDTGLDITHPELGNGTDGYNNLWSNSGEDAWSNPNDPSTGNGVDDDANGLIDDWRGWNFIAPNNNVITNYYHGTFVSGIIAAKTNNSRGIASVGGGYGGQGFRIMSLVVGSSQPNNAVIDDAILYAIAKGAKVIHLSLETGQTTAIDNAIQSAINNGIPVVCSTGNLNSAVGYPANNSNVIGVAASTTSDFRSSYSNYGSEVFIAAPGDDILSTKLSNTYGTASGTSFAAPLVSGVIGLLRQINSSLSITQIRNILSSTANKTGGYTYTSGHSNELGYGILDPKEAIENVLGGPIVGSDLICNNSNSSFSFTGTPLGTVTWSTSNTSILTINSSSGVATATATGNGFVNVIATMPVSCGSASVVKSVFVGAPIVYDITVNTSMCSGYGQVVTANTLNSATSLTWSVTSGNASNAYFTDYGTGSAYFNSYIPDCYGLTVYMSNTCGSSQGGTTICVDNCFAKYSVYPNPTRDYISIHFEQFDKTRVMPNQITLYNEKTQGAVYSIVNNQILASLNKEGVLQISVKDLPRGIYYLHVLSGENAEQKSITRVILE